MKKYFEYQKYLLTLRDISSGEMSPPSTGSAQSEASKYPPTEFSLKYAKVLAPNGKLVSPDQVFGEEGIFDKDVEEKTKLAFKVTMKKELFKYENVDLGFSFLLCNKKFYNSEPRYLNRVPARQAEPGGGGEQRTAEGGGD